MKIHCFSMELGGPIYKYVVFLWNWGCVRGDPYENIWFFNGIRVVWEEETI